MDERLRPSVAEIADRVISSPTRKDIKENFRALHHSVSLPSRLLLTPLSSMPVIRCESAGFTLEAPELFSNTHPDDIGLAWREACEYFDHSQRYDEFRAGEPEEEERFLADAVQCFIDKMKARMRVELYRQGFTAYRPVIETQFAFTTDYVFSGCDPYDFHVRFVLTDLSIRVRVLPPTAPEEAGRWTTGGPPNLAEVPNRARHLVGPPGTPTAIPDSDDEEGSVFSP
jgi:hypothetical protein